MAPNVPTRPTNPSRGLDGAAQSDRAEHGEGEYPSWSAAPSRPPRLEVTRCGRPCGPRSGRDLRQWPPEDAPCLETLGPWLVLFVIVGGMLALDLLVLNRDAKPVPFRRAAAWSGVWISLALGFGVFVAATLGSGAAGGYLAGYLIELSLSVDNVFVFALIFAAFAVPPAYQHRLRSGGSAGRGGVPRGLHRGGGRGARGGPLAHLPAGRAADRDGNPPGPVPWACRGPGEEPRPAGLSPPRAHDRRLPWRRVPWSAKAGGGSRRRCWRCS